MLKDVKNDDLKRVANERNIHGHRWSNTNKCIVQSRFISVKTIYEPISRFQSNPGLSYA